MKLKVKASYQGGGFPISQAPQKLKDLIDYLNQFTEVLYINKSPQDFWSVQTKLGYIQYKLIPSSGNIFLHGTNIQPNQIKLPEWAKKVFTPPNSRYPVRLPDQNNLPF